MSSRHRKIEIHLTARKESAAKDHPDNKNPSNGFATRKPGSRNAKKYG